MTAKEIRNQLKDMNLKAVSRGSGIVYATLYNFSRGRDCRASVVEKLSNYLENKENEHK